MLAGNQFKVVSTDSVSFDSKSFTLLYLPIIGRDAFALYQLLRLSDSGKITFFLEYLNFGPNQFSEALDKLSALDLVSVFDHHDAFYFQVKSPKNFEDFMKDDLLKQLLRSKVEEKTFKKLFENAEKPEGQNISRKFYEVYRIEPVEEPDEKSPAEKLLQADDFNMGAFELAMKDAHLTFTNETQDKLAIYQLAQKFAKNWFELFNLALQTQNQDGTINKIQLSNLILAETQPSSALTALPKPVQALLNNAKTHQPTDYLNQLRKNTGGTTSQAEYRILNDMVKKNLPDEVQNILLHYVLVGRKNSVLNVTFIHQLSNECLQNNIYTAQAALEWFNNREKRSKHKQTTYPAKPKLVKTAPEWSNANYVEQTSSEAQAKFAEWQQKMRKENDNGINRGNS